MSEQSAADRVANLRQVPVFAELDDVALEAVLDRAAEFEAQPGHVLVQPNQAGTGLFVIEEGTVRVELPGNEIELGPGEFFGELALLSEGATHSARVSAASPLRCLAIRRDDFAELLETQPRVAVAMLRVVAKRLSDATRH